MLAATPWPPGTPTAQSMWQVALLWLLLHEHEREGVRVHADPLGHPVTGLRTVGSTQGRSQDSNIGGAMVSAKI